MKDLPIAFKTMGNYKQFHCYYVTPCPKRAGKMIKMPCDLRGKNATSEFYANGMAYFDEAARAAEKLGKNYGVGFHFTENDPFFFLDLDDCYDPKTDRWTALATECLKTFEGAAVEMSTSGKGIHIFGSYKTIPDHGCHPSAERELYHTGRFVALTGIGARGFSGLDFTDILPAFINKYFPSTASGSKLDDDWWTDHPINADYGIQDNEKLVEKALKSKSKTGKPSFSELWSRNADVLSRAYPPDPSSKSEYGESGADAALAQHLAYWTANNAEQMKELMLASGLYREKYDRADYLPRTIKAACEKQTEWYSKKSRTTPATPSSDEEHVVPGKTKGYLTVQEMKDLFKDCVFISSEKGIFYSDGEVYGKEAFEQKFANRRFPLDEEYKKWTDSAWIAFKTSLAFENREVHVTMFDPKLKFGEIIKLDKKLAINKYYPQSIRIAEGDPAPFLDLMSKLFPDENDRKIVTSYMAAVVQYPGVKFNWCPYIQSIEGTGKSALSVFLAYAVGTNYVHKLTVENLKDSFNGYAADSILIVMDELNVPGNETILLEKLKSLITEEYAPVRKMYKDSVTIPVFFNVFATGNNKSGIRKTNSERRFAVFFCPQQQYEDLAKWGMTREYFIKLFDWAKGVLGTPSHNHGKAIVANYLLNYDLSAVPAEYNPANGGRAPSTTSEVEAIEYSLSVTEQEILDVIEEGVTYGFKGNFVSAVSLKRLLKEHGKGGIIGPSRQKEIMQRLGYVPHPCSEDSRTTRKMTDGSKPKIYVKSGTEAHAIRTASEMTEAYVTAQND